MEMAIDWKKRHADESCKALDHELVKEVIDEQMSNLAQCCGIREDDSLVRYGLTKIAMYAAQVARAQCLGFDPTALKLTASEGNEAMLELAAKCVAAGKPVTIIEG